MKPKRARLESAVVGHTITYKFPGLEDIVFDIDKCSEEVKDAGLINGFKQKLQDSTAIEYKQADGTSREPTLAEKRDRMSTVVQNLYDGNWRSTDNGGQPPASFLRALGEWNKSRFPDIAAARKFVSGAMEKQKVSAAAIEKAMLDWKNDSGETLGSVVTRIRAEGKDEGLENALLASLDAIGEE